MGDLAQVPIEPEEQSLLLDATLSVPGVIGVAVPGGICYLVDNFKIFFVTSGDSMTSFHLILYKISFLFFFFYNELH